MHDARDDAAVRHATAALRGAALAATTAAVSVRDQLPALSTCADGGATELSALQADLLRYRDRLTAADDEVRRLEHATVTYDRRVPAAAPLVGWHVPAVATARDVVDRTADMVTIALGVVRSAVSILETRAPLSQR